MSFTTHLIVLASSMFLSMTLFISIVNTMEKRRKYYFLAYGEKDYFLYDMVKRRFYFFLIFATIFLIECCYIMTTTPPAQDIF